MIPSSPFQSSPLPHPCQPSSARPNPIRRTLHDLLKKNIQHLHTLLIGESLPIDDPEIERTFTLFLETWRELHTAKSTNLNYGCQGRWDRVTGQQIPDKDVTVGNDKYYTVRAWMAVITYLMADWKYLYE